MKGSWRTSAIGIAGILTSLGVIVKALANDDYQTAMEMIAVLVTAMTGLVARDNKVKSESVGAE